MKIKTKASLIKKRETNLIRMSKIKAKTPNVPICESFIISSILSFVLQLKMASEVSAKPSRWRPPVIKTSQSIEITSKNGLFKKLKTYKKTPIKVPTIGKYLTALSGSKSHLKRTVVRKEKAEHIPLMQLFYKILLKLKW